MGKCKSQTKQAKEVRAKANIGEDYRENDMSQTCHVVNYNKTSTIYKALRLRWVAWPSVSLKVCK